MGSFRPHIRFAGRGRWVCGIYEFGEFRDPLGVAISPRQAYALFAAALPDSVRAMLPHCPTLLGPLMLAQAQGFTKE